MTTPEILAKLQSLGLASYKKVLLNHGINEPVFGVKIEELKKIAKPIRKNYKLSMELFDTGNYDAQYLAGIIADETKMTKKDLRHWLAKSNSRVLCGSTVAWIAAESVHGYELALEWIDANNEAANQAGWAILISYVGITNDAELDMARLNKLLQRVQATVHDAPDKVRYVMNGFVISVGVYVNELTLLAIEIGKAIGRVKVDMGQTACKVPSIVEYIKKVQDRGTIGKKRKSARC